MDRLDELLPMMKEQLLSGGISAAVIAHEPGRKARWNLPVVALSIDSCSCGTGAFLNYLGLLQNAETQDWEELYGKRMELCLGMDIFVPRDMGGRECGRIFDELCGILTELPAGLRLHSIHCGEVGFDEGTGMFRCPVKLECSAYLYALRHEDGIFTDFRLRGVTAIGNQK